MLDTPTANLIKTLEAELGSSLEALRQGRASAHASSMMGTWYGNEPGFQEELDLTAEEYYRDHPVVYEKDGKVTGLNLDRLRLTFIPESISRFEDLEHLSLSRNNIATVPKVIAGLRQLQRLDLSFNEKLVDVGALAGLGNLRSLALDHCKLPELPAVLACLQRLRTLLLQGNQLTRLLPALAMTELVFLDLSYNQLAELAGEMAGLSTLRHLRLGSNRLARITSLHGLDCLEDLDLSHNQLTELPDDVAALQQLQRLNLADNKLARIDPLAGLGQLESLDLSNNHLAELPGDMTGLKKLRYLNLAENRLTEIDPVYGLAQLEKLDLSDNQIHALPDGRQGLGQVKSLSITGNRIVEISSLSSLIELEVLNAHRNQIVEIPASVALLKSLSTLNVHGNPVKTPPYEVCQGGVEAIRAWYISSGRVRQDGTERRQAGEEGEPSEEMVPLHEIKMILVGNGNVGKTSLARRLQDRSASLPLPQERTHGLAVHRWRKEVRIPAALEPRTFQFNVWDFGGQGKFRSVQQLFCSRKSLYLYVTSPDDAFAPDADDYRGFQYWLSMVRAYSFDPETARASPMIHVSNKQDLGPGPVNEIALHATYPDLHPVTVRTSALTNEGLDSLEKVIETILPDVSFDVFTSTYSRRWLELKEALEERPEPYLSRVEYEKLARAHRLTDLEAEQWLRILHRLGTIIYFEAIPELRDAVILKPDWVREAAYAILRSEAIEEDCGRFRQRDFVHIWPGHTEEEQRKLVVLMQAFDLCYVTQDDFGNDLYIAPALFPAHPPQSYSFASLSPSHSTAFELRLKFHPFLPAGLLHRLMVRCHSWLYRSYGWRKTAVLHHRDTYAEITEDWEKKWLSVRLQGTAPRDLFNDVRQVIESMITGLREDKVLLQLGVSCEGLYQEAWWDLEGLAKLQVDFWRKREASNGVSLFISYAREDESFKDELVKHLSGLRHRGAVSDWHDRQILPGQEWDREIKEKLENSQIVIFLISSDFMHSDFIRDVEVARTVARHKDGEVTLVPVVIRPCDFGSMDISLHQALPLAPGEGIKAVSKWEDRDEAWLSIIEGLKLILRHQFQGRLER